MTDPITHDQDAQARRTRGATERACPEMVDRTIDIEAVAFDLGTEAMRRASAEIDRLRDKNTVLLRIIRAVEWSSYTLGGPRYCPVCGNGQTIGHDHDCGLAAALK